ncbi:MAG TPA: hypothetical protein PLU53_15295 [Bacteroidia bacterium]|nr:hypothetical protein [Bacteroidia bacterium]
MKKVTTKKAGAAKGADKKLDNSSLKKVKGGQTPLHRTTQIKGKGALS